MLPLREEAQKYLEIVRKRGEAKTTLNTMGNMMMSNL